MKINKNNFEAFLLDRIEGNIDPASDQMLTHFLELHPELLSAIDSTGLIYLPSPENIVFPDKGRLKRKATTIPFFRPIYRYASMAAVILIAIVSIVYTRNNHKKQSSISAHPVAVNSKASVVNTLDKDGSHAEAVPEFEPAKIQNAVSSESSVYPLTTNFTQAVVSVDKQKHNEREVMALKAKSADLIAAGNINDPASIQKLHISSGFTTEISAPKFTLHGIAAVLAYDVGNVVLPESVSRNIGIEDKLVSIEDVTLVVNSENNLLTRLLANVK